MDDERAKLPSGRDVVRRLAEWAHSLRAALQRKPGGGSRQHLMGHSASSQSSASSSNRHTSATATATDYTELNGGSVPCPSCNGSGLIPKELEGTLVALIPVNDERLKPKRTWLYILLWVCVCVVIGGAMIFVLMPRTVTLSSSRVPVETIHVTGKQQSYIGFHFMNRINVTSGNYLPIEVTNISATIVNKFQPWSNDVIGSGHNDTFSQVGPLDLYRSSRELFFNNTVELNGGVAEYCLSVFSKLTSLYVSMEFNVAVTISFYYGHTEQVTLSIQQQVCCIPSGNCTAG